MMKNNATSGLPPEGYLAKGDGIYQLTTDKEGNTSERWVCGPFEVVALTFNANSETWGRYIEFVDQHKVKQCWDIPSFTSKNKIIRGLRHRGLDMVADKAGRSAIYELVNAWKPAQPIKLSPAQLNVPGGTCISVHVGDGKFIGLDGVEFYDGTVANVGNPQGASAHSAIEAAEALEAWKKSIAAPCVGNPLLILGISTALAGPLLELLGLEGIGLHVWGRSASDKATILQVAASVWGEPKLVSSWYATANDFGWLVTATGSAFLALDELDAISSQEAEKAIETLAASAGKLRAISAGSTRYEARWRIPILSTGEVSLEEKMSKVGATSKADAEMHLIDIVADNQKYGAFDELHEAPNAGVFSQNLKSACTMDFGSAGPEFEYQLDGRGDDLRTFVKDWITKLEADMAVQYTLSNDSQVSHAVKQFALIAAAGELATDWEVTDWPDGTARDAAVEALGDWLKNRNAVVKAEVEGAV